MSKIDGASGVSVAISNKLGDYSAVVVSGANTKISEEFLYDNDLWQGVSFLMIQNEIKEEINLLAAQEARKRHIKVFFNADTGKNIDNLWNFVAIFLLTEIDATQISDDYSHTID